MVRLPDGQVRTLAARSDLLLGFDPNADRIERITEIPNGALLLMWTDGLVERRHEHLDVGIERLANAFRAAEPTSVDDICDQLLEAMLPESPEDDVAVLLVRPTALPPS
jgi:serine phosphatase RsbU (regulator of sigma subunit)